jgi:hypothetical protein
MTPVLLCLLLAGTLRAAEPEPVVSPTPGASQTEPETIVPPTDQVSEFDARRELANVLRKLGQTEGAEHELRKLLQMKPGDPGITADLADLEISRGHFAIGRDLYEKALRESSNSMEMRLRLARQERAWGDFYRAENVFRTDLKDHPKDTNTTLEFATVLIGEQLATRAISLRGTVSAGWDSQWRSFESIFAAPLNELKQVASGRPLAVFETASAYQGGDKEEWIISALDSAKSLGLGALIWFQVNKETDWRLEVHVSEAVRSAIQKQNASIPAGSRWLESRQ